MPFTSEVIPHHKPEVFRLQNGKEVLNEEQHCRCVSCSMTTFKVNLRAWTGFENQWDKEDIEFPPVVTPLQGHSPRTCLPKQFLQDPLQPSKAFSPRKATIFFKHTPYISPSKNSFSLHGYKPPCAPHSLTPSKNFL